MKPTLILNAEQFIKNANDNIENNIDVLCPDNLGLCAQNILSQIRNLIDAFALLRYRIDYPNIVPESGSERIKKAISNLKARDKQFGPFVKMYEYIEMVASHYTQDQFGSIALLQRYSDLLQDLKECAKAEFGIDVLNNLNNFPFEIDDTLRDYYFAIYRIIKGLPAIVDTKTSTFYVERKRRRYLSNNTYIYEYVLSPANDKRTKFDRLTAFSLLNLNKTHSVRCSIYTETIGIFDIKTSVSIIKSYSISIRPCELKKYAYLEGFKGFSDSFGRDSAGYQELMSFLTLHEMTIYDVVFEDDRNFNSSIAEIQGPGKSNSVIEFLKFTRETINKRDIGFKTLTYLLYLFKHKVMKYQTPYSALDRKLGDTNLSDGCTLFEISPFSFSLRKHNRF